MSVTDTAPVRLVKVAGTGSQVADLPFAPGWTVAGYLAAAEVRVPHDAAVSLNGVEVTPDKREVNEADVSTADPAGTGAMLAAITVSDNVDNG